LAGQIVSDSISNAISVMILFTESKDVI